MIFSKRLRASEEAEEWCYANGAKVCALNIVTALDALGYLRPDTIAPDEQPDAHPSHKSPEGKNV